MCIFYCEIEILMDIPASCTIIPSTRAPGLFLVLLHLLHFSIRKNQRNILLLMKSGVFNTLDFTVNRVFAQTKHFLGGGIYYRYQFSSLRSPTDTGRSGARQSTNSSGQWKKSSIYCSKNHKNIRFTAMKQCWHTAKYKI